MNSQSATLFRFAFTIAAGLVFASSGWAANLVYYRFGPTGTAGLYDFNTDTQLSTLRVAMPGGIQNFALAPASLAAARPSDISVFALDPGTIPTKLVRFDVNTGLKTFIGTLNSNSFKLAIDPATGELWSVGTAGVSGTRALYRINPTNANETFVGNLPTAAGPLEFLNDGTLLCYSLGGTLYRLDPTTAEATAIGAMTPRLNPVIDSAHVGNRLFLTGSTGSGADIFIWEVDVATAKATLLGPQSSLGAGGGAITEILPMSRLTIAVATISIKFPSLIGTTYQVQYRSPGTLDIWTDLGDPIPGTGNEISILDSDLDDVHRTYRLQMFP